MPQLPPRYPERLDRRVDFRPDGFRRLIATHGSDLTWEMCSECPCARPAQNLGLVLDAQAGGQSDRTTRQPNPSCPSCKGLGYLYHSSQPIKGLVLSPNSQTERANAGERPITTVSITVLPEHRLNVGDRLVLRDDPVDPDNQRTVVLYRETHTYNGEATSRTRYPVVSVDLDTFPGQTRGVVHLYVADANGEAQLNGERVEGVDFTVVGGQIQWINAPGNNARWSISYYGAPTYTVVSLPNIHRDTQVGFKRATPQLERLPVRAICRAEFLSGGEVTRAT